MIQLLGLIGIGGTELIFLLVLGALCFLLPVIALVDIVRSQFTDPNNKLIWVIIVLFLNILGAVLYFAIGRKQRVP